MVIWASDLFPISVCTCVCAVSVYERERDNRTEGEWNFHVGKQGKMLLLSNCVSVTQAFIRVFGGDFQKHLRDLEAQNSLTLNGTRVLKSVRCSWKFPLLWPFWTSQEKNKITTEILNSLALRLFTVLLIFLTLGKSTNRVRKSKIT